MARSEETQGKTQAARVLVHATAVVLGTASEPFGAALDGAILLTGASGSGKSDVALRLIAMGARLLADDQTALFVEGGALFAEAPSSLYGRMEIRGVGIIAIEPVRRARPVILAVQLDGRADIARLPEPAFYGLPPGLSACREPPCLTLKPFEPSTPAKIAATASAIARGAFVAGIASPSSGIFS